MQGLVLVDDSPVTKVGAMVRGDASIRLKESSKLEARFVSRGGEKLQAAIDYFPIDCRSRVAIDIGSSTGGFTDCLLQNGASLVYAVDVGTAQLAHKLRQDPRVEVFERTNAKELNVLPLSETPDLAVIDVSFISVRKLLPSLVSILKQPSDIIALIKPQFELGPELVGKGGVVRNEAARQQAVKLVEDYAQALGLKTMGTIASPITGAKKGNQEYLCYLRLTNQE